MVRGNSKKKYLVYSNNNFRITTTQKLTQTERKLLVRLLFNVLQFESVRTSKSVTITYDEYVAITGQKCYEEELLINFADKLVGKDILVVNDIYQLYGDFSISLWVSSIIIQPTSKTIEFKFSETMINLSEILYTSLSDDVLSKSYCYN